MREARPQAVRHPRQSRLVRRPQRLRQPVLLLARQALQRQRQRHRRLAVPAAPQLLGAAPALQLVDLGRRHPVLEVSRQPRRSTTSSAWPSRWARRTTSIICLAEPSWLMADLQGAGRGGELLQDHDDCARKRGARVVAVIAGDWHHYNRYYAHELDVHFITSGGGGAFLHPDARAQERHLGALARAPGGPQEGRDADSDRRAPRRGLEGAATTTSASSATPRRPRASSSRPCRTCRTPSSRCSAKACGCASARRIKPQAPKCYPEQGPQLPAEPRQRAVPVLQPGLRHRHRLDLLARSPGSSRTW